MPVTYPLPTLSAVIDANGITLPTFEDILLSLQAKFREIYGSDIYLEEDSQDGQFIGMLSQLIYDNNKAHEATYLSFSPSTAQGAALSSQVKINGLKRNLSSKSQAPVRVFGAVGATIVAGQVADINGNVWLLPAAVVIGGSAYSDVTATAALDGAISAGTGTINIIRTPTRDWESVTNTGPASEGEPVEEDPDLRSRQSRSVALPNLTVLEGVVAAVEAITGVIEVSAFENDTDATDANGLPEHSICLVVNGGDNLEVATAINKKKGPGASTFGSTVVDVVDGLGITKPIRFYRTTDVLVLVDITATAKAGYSSLIGDEARQAVFDYINALKIGEDLERLKLFMPAQLFDSPNSDTFALSNVLISIKPAATGTGNVVAAINQRIRVLLADITFVAS